MPAPGSARDGDPAVEQSSSQRREFLARIVSEAFSGPYPPPDMLRAYEEICPGMARQLLEETRIVSQHKMGIENKLADARIKSMNRDYDEGRMGQLCAVVVCGMMVAGVVLLGQAHAQWVGSILGAGTAGTIVTAFIFGRKHGRKAGHSLEQQSEADGLPHDDGADSTVAR